MAKAIPALDGDDWPLTKKEAGSFEMDFKCWCHTLSVDIADLQMDHLGDAQTGAVPGHQEGLVTAMSSGVKNPLDLSRTEDRRQTCAFISSGDEEVRVFVAERDPIEEAKTEDVTIAGSPSQASIFDQVN